MVTCPNIDPATETATASSDRQRFFRNPNNRSRLNVRLIARGCPSRALLLQFALSEATASNQRSCPALIRVRSLPHVPSSCAPLDRNPPFKHMLSRWAPTHRMSHIPLVPALPAAGLVAGPSR